MPPRIRALAAIGCLVLASCSIVQQPTPSAAPTTSTSSAPKAIDGGCGNNQLFAPPGPTTLPGLDASPWARATPAGAGLVAYFWGDPPYLAAGDSRPGGQSNKVLWISDSEPSGRLVIVAHPPDAASSDVSFDFPSAAAPSGNYPSLVDLPTAGCWHLELILGARRATIDVLVAPRPAG